MKKEFDPYLEVDGVTVDNDDVTMLRAIADRGSLSGAAEALERSYSRLQQRVVALEEAAGPLVERTRGGADGGGSDLTPQARELIGRFDRLVAAYEGVARVDETVLSGPVVDREGELATVETTVGPILAVVPSNAAAATVTIGSDAVSLHDPAGAPHADETSVRNRFDGTVSWLDTGEAIVRVGIALGSAEGTDGTDTERSDGTGASSTADAPNATEGPDAAETSSATAVSDPTAASDATELVALLTRRSVDALGLEPGRPVVASVKATAVRGVSAVNRGCDDS